MSRERNPFQEGLYVGLGLAMRTRDKIEEFGKKITREYRMNEIEGKNFMDDLMKESEETQSRLDELIEKKIETYFDEAGIAKKEDIDTLTKKIDSLEKSMNKK
jgi:polyhydroxyalkanoate synthesis regulator phasin